jgi:carbon dioxide concentrating mechanism protein CcmN
MHLFTLQPSEKSQVMVSGPVTIHPSAVLAPGSLLHADPESELILGPGVCIGMGVVIHAHGGTLRIESGANLGAAVLVMGHGVIAAQCCIGSSATLLNPQLEAGQVVAPGTVNGHLIDAPVPEAAPEPEASTTATATETLPRNNSIIGEVFLSQLRMTLFPQQPGI